MIQNKPISNGEEKQGGEKVNPEELLKKYNIPQPLLANEMGLTRQAVNLWFSGKITPNPRSIKKIAEAMNRLGAETTQIEVYEAFVEEND